MKKLYTFAIALLAAVACLFLLPTEAQAAAVSDLTFSLNEDGASYSVSDCNESASGELVIPSTYNGKPVTEIGKEAFYYCTELTSVTIPESVTDLYVRAFSNCTSLTSVVIPEGVTTIWAAVFYGCSSLTDITIPDSVTTIGSSAFAGCSSLTALLSFPDHITHISSGMYENCTGLTSITIPAGIKEIGACTFSGCRNLRIVTIPDSITRINAEAFNNCDNIAAVYYGGTKVQWNTIDFSVGNKALQDATIHTVPSAEDYLTFRLNRDGASYDVSDCNESASGELVIPSTYNGKPVTGIGTEAFWKCAKLTRVTIPDGVTAIGHFAFSGCKSMTEIILPNSMQTIGPDSFSECTSLVSITIPDGVQQILVYTFDGCSSLTSITIPSSVTSISSAFTRCTALTDVYYHGTEEQWKKVNIISNDPLHNATVHYNYIPVPEPDAELNVNRAIIRLQEQMKMGFYYEMETNSPIIETGAIVWTGEEYAKETSFDINHAFGKRYPGKAENDDGTYYSIETDGIPAQAIDTVLYILPYAKTANGYSYAEVVKSNSILNVAKNQYNDPETSADVKAVIVDVLNYATAARNYFVAKGEMEAPTKAFNAILSEAEKALKWSDELLAVRSAVKETESEYAPKTDKVYINIEDSLKIQFVFADSSVVGGLYWQGKDYTGSSVHDSTTATGQAYIAKQNGYVSCAIRGINSYNIYDDFYLRGYNAEGQLTKTYTHSIAAYLTNQIKACEGKTDAESQALVELCKAMLIYGKSAQENDAVKKG